MASLLLEGSAFITGAASGIGQQTAFSFAKYGINKLALADINLQGLEQTAATVREKWPLVEVLTLQLDVADAAQVKHVLAQVAAKFGRLDVAVNNAGIVGRMAQSHELSEEDWLKVADVNMHGVFRCQKEELAIMIEQEDLGPRRGRGAIVNLSSIYGVRGPANPIYITAYSACKHAVMGMTKADANAYAGSNIRINAICPGYTKTPILEAIEGDIVPGHPLYEHAQQTALKRLATAEEIADSITFLASPLSSFVNGVGLVVDGGFTSS